VRQTEALIQQLRGEKPTHTPKPPPSPEVVAIEERLRAHLGTKVSLNKRKNGGTLVIHFYSDEELNSLLDTFLLDEE
jgi:ParB family chromosome partitioning protein